MIVASPGVDSDPDGKPSVLLVCKSDGGYGYATTDLATIRYRVQELKADRLIYVTDGTAESSTSRWSSTPRESAADRAGTAAPKHSPSAPCSATTAGRSRPPPPPVALQELLESALERARAIVDQRNPELPEAERAAVATAVGIGAVKYADLSTSRQRDLVFSLRPHASRSTATPRPHTVRVRARAASIKARANERSTTVTELAEPIERTLVLKLGRLRRHAPDLLTDTLEPHRLCTYLYEPAGLVTAASTENCPVLNADTPEIAHLSRLSRSAN